MLSKPGLSKNGTCRCAAVLSYTSQLANRSSPPDTETFHRSTRHAGSFDGQLAISTRRNREFAEEIEACLILGLDNAASGRGERAHALVPFHGSWTAVPTPNIPHGRVEQTNLKRDSVHRNMVRGKPVTPRPAQRGDSIFGSNGRDRRGVDHPSKGVVRGGESRQYRRHPNGLFGNQRHRSDIGNTFFEIKIQHPWRGQPWRPRRPWRAGSSLWTTATCYIVNIVRLAQDCKDVGWTVHVFRPTVQ